MQTAVVAVNVVHFKPQLLNHLKVVVNNKSLRKPGTQAVLDLLCSANLSQIRVLESFFLYIVCKITFCLTAGTDIFKVTAQLRNLSDCKMVFP